jgi:tetratricopeptide (TPR) repeat protein
VLLIWTIQIFAAGSAEPGDSNTLVEWRASITNGSSLYEQGRLREAAQVLEKAVAHAERLPGLDARLPASIHALAFVYQQQGNYAQATSAYWRAIHLWEKFGPSQKDALRKSIDNLIGNYMEARDYAAAKSLLATRLPEMEETATQWRDRATLLDMQSSLAFIQRDYREAERLLSESLALWEQNFTGRDSNMAIVLMNLSHVFGSTKRYQAGLDMIVRALGMLETLNATAGSLAVRSLDYAGFLCVKLRRPAEAEEYYRRALTRAKEVFGPENAVPAHIMLSYSGVLRGLQRGTEARLMAREARTVLQHSSQERNTVDIVELAPAR